MAKLSLPELIFDNGCPDCGQRRIQLPDPLPEVGDDFNWQARTYEEFRQVMLEELAARFPERKRWNPADLEVVLIEALAGVLDQLADMNDRVTAENFLETARQPDNVYRLLGMIGYDASEAEGLESDEERRAKDKLLELWENEPRLMETARSKGPREIHTQARMVTLDDYGLRIDEHPLVSGAHAWSEWGGSWPVIHVAVTLWENHYLDDVIDLASLLTNDVTDEIDGFHATKGLRKPDWSNKPAIRTILRIYLDAWRMIGQEVILEDAEPVGIAMSLSVGIQEHYFQTEVRYAIEEALGTDTGGFFEPGRLKFGEDLYAGDIYQTLMSLDGVETVCLNRFKRMGKKSADYTAQGFIPLDGLEIAICDNNPAYAKQGYFSLSLHGGLYG